MFIRLYSFILFTFLFKSTKPLDKHKEYYFVKSQLVNHFADLNDEVHKSYLVFSLMSQKGILAQDTIILPSNIYTVEKNPEALELPEELNIDLSLEVTFELSQTNIYQSFKFGKLFHDYKENGAIYKTLNKSSLVETRDIYQVLADIMACNLTMDKYPEKMYNHELETGLDISIVITCL